MSSKLNLFFAEGDDDHVVEYGFKFNGDFIMIEKFDNISFFIFSYDDESM